MDTEPESQSIDIAVIKRFEEAVVDADTDN